MRERKTEKKKWLSGRDFNLPTTCLLFNAFKQLSNSNNNNKQMSAQHFHDKRLGHHMTPPLKRKKKEKKINESPLLVWTTNFAKL